MTRSSKSMGESPIKRANSKSKNLADAAKETDTEECKHNYSIRGYLAEVHEKDFRKCWPFSEKSASLTNKNTYSLPLHVPKFRFWNCKKCIKDIEAEADGTKDKVMPEEEHLKARHINSWEMMVAGTSVIPPSPLASPNVIDRQEEESNAGNEGDENEDVNIERSQNDNRRVTRSQKKVHPQSMEASTPVRSKSRKLERPAQRSTDTGRSREKQNVDRLAVTTVVPSQVVVAATTVAPSEVAVVVEDTLPHESINPKDCLVLLESDNLSSESLSPSTSGLPRRKTRKVRLVKDLLDDKSETKASGGSKSTRKEESSCQKESVLGQKRKVEHYCYVRRKSRKAGATTENAFKSIDADQAERVQEGVRESHADPGESDLPTCVESLVKEKDSVPSSPRPKRTARKSVIYNNKSNQIMSGSGTDEGNQVTLRAGPSINASSQPTEDLLSEKRVGSLLDDELASEGYFRKHVPQVNDEPDNDHMRSRDAQANCVTRELGSSSKSNTGGWLTTEVDAVDFSSNNNTSSSTEAADQASVPQKDASGADRKGKAIMVQDQNENTPKEQNDSILDKEEDVSNKEPPQQTPNKTKKPVLIDLNVPYVDGTSLEENDRSRAAPETCDTNSTREEDHFLIGQQQKSLGLFPRSRPSPFGIFAPNQENRASSIRFSGQNFQRLGNVPTMGNPSPSSHWVLPACNTGQSVPHQAPTRPIWTSPMIPPQYHPNPVPFNMDPSMRRCMLSQAPSIENTRNLNPFGANGNQRCGHGAGVNSSRSMGAFSNDSSMALNRLSRTDPLARSNVPAYQHRYTRRQFPLVSQPRERVQLQAGDSSKTPYQPKQLTLDPYSNRFAPESSRKSFPSAPPIGTSSFPFQNGQAPWSRHQQEINTQRTDAIAPVYSSLARPVFPSSASQGISFQLLGSSSSMKLPLSSLFKEKEVKQKRKEESCRKASASPPMNSTSEFGPCSLNRNPADFTIPEPGDVYMLTGKDLRGEKRGTYKKKGSSGKQVGPIAESG